MACPDSTKTYPGGAPCRYGQEENPSAQENIREPKNAYSPQIAEQHDDLDAITPEPKKGSLFQGFDFQDIQLPDESIDTTSFGNMEYSVLQTNNCFYTAKNILEVKRDIGIISIDLKIPQGAIPVSSLLIRVALVKKQGTKNFGATIICPEHRYSKQVISPGHILHPGKGLRYYFDSKNMNNSLCFQLSQFKDIQDSGTVRMRIRSLCTSTCPINNDPNYIHNEAENGNILVLSLEAPIIGTVLARTSFPIEVKNKTSSLNPKRNKARSKQSEQALTNAQPGKRRITPRGATIAAKQKEKSMIKGMKKILMGASEVMKAMEYPNIQLIKDIELEAQKPFHCSS